MMVHSLCGLMESLLAVSSKGITLHLGQKEHVDLILKHGAAWEETCDQPKQLPAPLLAGTGFVVGQLFDNLAVDFIS